MQIIKKVIIDMIAMKKKYILMINLWAKNVNVTIFTAHELYIHLYDSFMTILAADLQLQQLLNRVLMKMFYF